MNQFNEQSNQASASDLVTNELKEQGIITPQIVPIKYGDFKKLNLKSAEFLLYPIIEEQGLAMIYAMRGVGKTHVSLNIAYAVATGGSFLKWKARRPAKVLFIDGEMPAYALHERLKVIDQGRGFADDNLNIITPDLLKDKIPPDLATSTGWKAVEAAVNDVDLIIVDNISTLCRNGRDNEADSWIPVQHWALKWRAQGKAILFIHHSNKNGDQRGTSKKEDVLSTVIKLEHEEGYSAEDGAAFRVSHTKSRLFHGEDAKPFKAALTSNGWVYEDCEAGIKEEVWALHNDGMKQVDIARELGLEKYQVTRIIQKHKKCDGILRTV
ncbi:AAA family ATPase [Fastidiosibacter lacustris]|uniref:AAA family ATPase n=1 Tax=Fastidiosibacter lacustris TaxID=2056695 RepID=UPI000E348E4F|nr:AAA family ATPase [Fastidiosibacter lacustris]